MPGKQQINYDIKQFVFKSFDVHSYVGNTYAFKHLRL